MFALTRRNTAPCVILIVLATGCSVKKSDPAVAATGGADTVAPTASSDPSISDEEREQFCQQVEQAVAANKSDELHALIDWDAILDKVTQGVEFDPEFAKGFRAGMMKTSGGAFEQRICKAVADGGDYKFLHMQKIDGYYGPLFRLREEGTNYHLYTLARSKDGKIRANDLYVVASGENMVQTLRRVFVASATKPGFVERLQGKDNLYRRNLDSIVKMNTAFQEGRPADALKIYKTLPSEVQKEKFLMLMHIYFSQPVDDHEYLAAIAAYRQAFPSDGASDLLSIDYYLIKKQFQQAREAVDRLDKLVGGDPYLAVLKAGVYLQEEKLGPAAETIERAIEADPTMLDSYWTRVGIALQAKDHAATLAWLKQLDANFTMDWSDLAQTPQYADFVTSDEYQEWITLHPVASEAPAAAETEE